MSDDSPQILWERTDGLLSGGAIAIRGVSLPHDGEPHGAVAVTFSLPAEAVQVGDDSVTATLLVGPSEALGISAWLREAAQAAEPVGPPLYDWSADTP